MKSVEVLALVLKVFSIYLLLKILAGLSGLYSLFQFTYEENSDFFYLAWFNVLYCGLGLVLFILLWNFPVAVAKYIIPKSNDDSFPILDANSSNLEVIAFTSIGVAILAFSIPDLGYNIAYHFYLSTEEMGSFFEPRNRVEALLNVLHSAGRLLIGIVLCFFSGSVSAAINRVRGRG